MKLFIRRSTDASGCLFVLYDESGNEKYKVFRKAFKLMPIASYRIADVTGDTAAKIRRLPFVGAKTFALKANRSRVNLVLLPTQQGVFATFYGNNWHVNGNIAAKNFSVIDVDKTEVFRHIRHSRYGELEIFDEENELLCVAAAICINLLNTVEKHALKAANV